MADTAIRASRTRPAAPRSRTLATWQRRVPGFLMAAPAVAVFLAMFIVPMILAFVLSLTDWNGYSVNLNFIGFENYLHAFQNPRTVNAAIFTFVVALIGTVLCNAIGLAAGLTEVCVVRVISRSPSSRRRGGRVSQTSRARPSR